VTAEEWVTSKLVRAILQIRSSNLSQLKNLGTIRSKDGLYNLKDVLDRYKMSLRAEGVIDDQIEAVCIREFKAGAIPEEVIDKHGFAWLAVKQAWQNFDEMRSDPRVERIRAEREAARKHEEQARCRDCLRVPTLSHADSLRIVSAATDDPTRTALTIDEERACAGLDIRCPVCRALKSTAPIESMRARIRTLRVMGPPTPVNLPPLPTSATNPPTPPAPTGTQDT
jgi:hypothetical protein